MAQTYVLVHGAWHGGWCWRHVRKRLTDAGHGVFAPSLTGMGARHHLGRPDTDLNTHIADIVALIDVEELRDVVLVGHSYGGFVISGVAAARPTALARLVFVDAFVPEDGESVIAGAPPERIAAVR
ncbi:MAG: alpha/beta fold hydrolase, partial [Alphaproteobacteria bacterium]